MVRAGDILIALTMGIVFYVFVYKSQWFQNFLTQRGGGGGTTTTTTTGGGTTGGGGGGTTTTTGGGTATGSHVYPTTSNTCGCVGATQPLHTSKGTCTTIRSNCNNCALLNYEATAILQFGGGCSCGGDEATIKHYGPTHQDGNCCWAMSVVNQDGSCAWGGEGPHGGTTNKNQGTLGSVGSLVGKTVGIKSVIWKTSGGAHQELFVDPSGAGTSWKKMGARDMAEWGDVQKTNIVGFKGGPQQVEFRVDCTQAKWLSTSVVEITPGGATTTPAAPAAKTPATTKKPLPALAALRMDRAQTALIPMIRSTVKLPHYDFRKLDKQANHFNDADECGYVYDNRSDVISRFYKDYFKYRVDKANHKPTHRVFTSNMRR